MKNRSETVLAYLKKNDSYLLLYRNKKECDLNKGKWIGLGGHIEIGETPEQALKREIKEESNLDVISYKLKAKILFIENDYEEIMYLYIVPSFKGKLKECDEGTLEFIKEKDIFSLNLWEGDKIFLEKLFNDDPFFEMTLRYKDNELVEVKDYLL